MTKVSAHDKCMGVKLELFTSIVSEPVAQYGAKMFAGIEMTIEKHKIKIAGYKFGV